MNKANYYYWLVWIVHRLFGEHIDKYHRFLYHNKLVTKYGMII